MEHFTFAFYILSFAIGTASMLLSGYLFARYRTKALRHYVIFLLIFVLLAVFFMLDIYPSISSSVDSRSLEWPMKIIQTLFGVLYIINAPFFFFSLMGIKMGKGLRKFFIAFDIIYFVLALLWLISGKDGIVSVIIIPLFYGMIGYNILFSIINLKKVADRRLKSALRVFLILSAFFFPLFLLDSVFYYHIEWPSFFENGLYTVPLYQLILGVLTIIFAIRYLNEPAYLESGQVSAYFRNNYSITEREAEIITYLIRGYSNREIGDSLFISLKTVENHITHIYQKTGVQNRIALLHLLLSRQSV